MTEPEEAFLQRFFGRGNALSVEGMALDKAADLQRWIDHYLSGAEIRPFPRITGPSGRRRTSWYVLVDDIRVATVAREEIRAFIGRSYSDFDPFEDRLDASDPVDEAVLRMHLASFRFTVETSTSNSIPEVRKLLWTWLDLRARRPTRTLARGSSLADNLYGFEEALRLARWAAAEEWLSQIEAVGLLTEENIYGLEILLDDARGYSGAAWENRGFDRLVAKRSPRRIQLAMLRSAYRHVLADHERAQDAESCLAAFRDVILPRSRPLLAASIGVGTPEAGILLFLGHLLSDSPDANLVSSARRKAEELGADSDWMARLQGASRVELKVAPDFGEGSLDRAIRAFNRNNLDFAWSLASDGAASWDRVVLLLRIAGDGDSLTWAGEAIEAFRTASDTLPEAPEYAFALTLVAALQRRFQEVGTPTEEPIPSGWLDWASRLGRSGAWLPAVKLAEAGMVEWPASSLSGEGLFHFAREIGSVHDDNAPFLRRATPYILGMLDVLPSNEPGMGEVLDTLLRVATLDASPGEWYFPSITDLLERRFRCGISDPGYKVLIGDIRDAVSMHGAPEAMDALVDLFEVLERYRCPHPAERQEVGAGIMAIAGRFLHRMDLTHLVVIKELARVLEVDLVGLQEQLNAAWSGPEGKRAALHLKNRGALSVALYSLEPGALRRAKQALEATIPGLVVQATADTVATDSLLATAKSVDLFVVAHRSATHAATDAIRSARSGHIVYAEGKGSSSLVRAVLDWATSLAPA